MIFFKGSCTHHDGFIYDNASADLAYSSFSEAIRHLSKLEADGINTPDRREEIEREKNKFKWICCGATLQLGSSGMGGCKKGKHGYLSQQPNQYQVPPEQRQPVERLNENMIRKWETTCREIYNDQWINIIRHRKDMLSTYNSLHVSSLPVLNRSTSVERFRRTTAK